MALIAQSSMTLPSLGHLVVAYFPSHAFFSYGPYLNGFSCGEPTDGLHTPLALHTSSAHTDRTARNLRPLPMNLTYSRGARSRYRSASPSGLEAGKISPPCLLITATSASSSPLNPTSIYALRLFSYFFESRTKSVGIHATCTELPNFFARPTSETEET
ncbi:hypothetical protein DFH09DRAFT_1101774 [Mycena vulgaris]|nr:hypothetical protein DFH09DRAFT_1101774 [Mycena vulgaris]